MEIKLIRTEERSIVDSGVFLDGSLLIPRAEHLSCYISKVSCINSYIRECKGKNFKFYPHLIKTAIMRFYLQ